MRRYFIILGIGITVIVILFTIFMFFQTTVKVTFNSNGASKIKSQRVLKNQTIIEPKEPTRTDGLNFMGWFYNGEKWNFETNRVTENIELTAQWNWDGKTANYDWFDESKYEQTQEFYIDNGSQLYALALLVRGESTESKTALTFENKDIILTNDINIINQEWTPIGSETMPFKGNLIGQNHKISGLTITDENTNLTGFDAALFGSIEGTKENPAIIKDLTVDEVEINLTKKDGTNYAAGAIVGILINGEVSNVTASGSISVNTNASTVAGMFIVNEDTVKMENVTNNVKISGSRNNATSSVMGYFILGGITGQITGDGPFYYKNCTNNADIIMDNPFEEDLTEYIGNYTSETIAGHIVGQTAGPNKLRVIFDNCTKSDTATIYGAHMYHIVADNESYKLEYQNPAVMQGKRYIDAENTIDYGYDYIAGNTDISFVYGNETLYFVPLGTAFNLETINDDYKTKLTPGFIDSDNCFYSTKVATTKEDIEKIAEGKWLISYAPGDNAIIYTINN